MIAVCAIAPSWWVATLVRGRNYSDVGVWMYENGRIAACLGILTYTVCIFLISIITRLFLPPISKWAKIISRVILLLISVFYFIVLIFGYC